MLGVHRYGAPEYLCGIDGAFPRILFVVLEFPELRPGELLEYGMHLAEEKAAFAVHNRKPTTRRPECSPSQIIWPESSGPDARGPVMQVRMPRFP